MRALIPALLLTSLTACVDVKETTSDTESSTNCVTEWECVNSVCECADGSSCTEATCDDECEVCD